MPGLRYATDARPGITRRRAGEGFSYRDADGATDPRSRDTRADPGPGHPAGLDRRLDLPVAERPPAGDAAAMPAAASSTATTRAGSVGADADKFDRMLAFAAALPRDPAALSTRTSRRAGLPREKVLAAVVRLLELTLIRVGNDEYARLNRSFGLTTLRDRHARIEGSRIRFRFRGKSGQPHEVGLRDRRLAAVVRRCQDLPGQELFQYVDEEGEVRDVASDDVNAYLREASGGDFTAKDFRTWAGTVLAYRALRALQPVTGERAAQAQRRRGDPPDRRPAREHAGRRPRQLRPPGRAGGVPRRLDPRARSWRPPRSSRRRRPARPRPRKRPSARCCVSGWRTMPRDARPVARSGASATTDPPASPPAQAADS